MAGLPGLATLVYRLALAGVCLWVLAGTVGAMAGPDPLAVDAPARLHAPSAAHLMGTDQFGRDVAARVLAGARYALVGVGVSTLVAGIAGVALGVVVGYAGGWVDAAAMRLVDLWLALPSILFAIAIVGAFGPSFFNAMLAVGFMRVPSFARVARTSVMAVRRAGYVEAAHAAGASRGRVVWRHVLPNVGGPLVALASARASTALLAGSALSFVGLGAPIPEPEWGALVAGGRPYLHEAWWVVFFPGAAIVLVALSLQLLGDALQNRLDARSR